MIGQTTSTGWSKCQVQLRLFGLPIQPPMKRLPFRAALPLLLYARGMLADVGLPAKAGYGGDGLGPLPPADRFEIAGGKLVLVDAAQDEESVDAGGIGPDDIGAQG